LPKICVEIFAIGNELCYGKIYDTNSFWIAEQATHLGANVQRITCIRDDVETIRCGLSEALSRNPQFIILTGGLGPTSDDLTIEALSKLLNSRITINKDVLKIMAERKKMVVEDLPPHLVKMLRTIEGAECLPNPLGWAPVTVIHKGETTIIALPGPPKEVKACFAEYVAGKIRERTGCESESKRVFVNMYESQVSPITDEIMKSMSGAYLKPLVSEYQPDKGLPIEVIAFAENKEACQKKIMEIIERLEKLVTQKNSN
jgi:molybdenum cofactor synthesis domain-containing protein